MKKTVNITSISRLFLIAIILVTSLALPRRTWACSCVMPEPANVAFAEAEAVFLGEVTGIFPIPTSSKYVPFAVSESWKGVTTDHIVIRTGFGGGDCGFGFVPGQTYVVYAYEYNDALETGICTRTNTESRAATDLTYLRTQPSLTLTATPSWTLFCGGSLLLLLGLITAGIWQLRKRR